MDSLNCSLVHQYHNQTWKFVSERLSSKISCPGALEEIAHSEHFVPGDGIRLINMVHCSLASVGSGLQTNYEL